MKEPCFEEALERLEEIVRQLEEGEVTLEESLTAFEEGISLARQCSQYLDQAEKRVEVILEDEEGNLKLTPFEAEGAEEE